MFCAISLDMYIMVISLIQKKTIGIFSFNNETNMMNNSKEAKIDEVA